MNQHPIPQNVTTYQFRLIGDMTIQQFIFLSIGVGGAIFFYYTNLFSLIKWALVAGSAMGGFAVAFMPYEDRPLDQWIINYIRAIYRPTRFIWRKQPKTPELFSFTTNGSILPADADEIARVAATRRQQGLQSFLVTLPNEVESNSLDSAELAQTTNITSLFSESAGSAISQPPILPTTTTSTLNIAASDNITIGSPLPKGDPEPSRGRELRPTVSGVIAEIPVQVDKISDESPLLKGDGEQSRARELQIQPTSNTFSATETSGKAVAATTSSQLPFPSTPTTPNTIVGMVLSKDEKIVENAIIEVVDEAGFPVRATRTNQLGQFFSTTPLKRGVYRIIVEKADLNFDTIEISLNGQTLSPLKIVAL